MKESTQIGFIVAMKEEAEILASAIGLREEKNSRINYCVYSNSQKSIVLISPGTDNRFIARGHPVCRVGKVAAGVITAILVNGYDPHCIINAGTAGGIAKAGMNIGDIVVADSVASHDMRIPLSGYKEYGTRKILLTHIQKLSYLSATYKIGLVSSGESFATTPEEWKILRSNKAVAKDMEASGILQALELLNTDIPVYVIKSITDLVDEHVRAQTSSEDFRKNFHFAMKKLSVVIKNVVENSDKII